MFLCRKNLFLFKFYKIEIKIFSTLNLLMVIIIFRISV